MKSEKEAPNTLSPLSQEYHFHILIKPNTSFYFERGWPIKGGWEGKSTKKLNPNQILR